MIPNYVTWNCPDCIVHGEYVAGLKNLNCIAEGRYCTQPFSIFYPPNSKIF